MFPLPLSLAPSVPLYSVYLLQMKRETRRMDMARFGTLRLPLPLSLVSKSSGVTRVMLCSRGRIEPVSMGHH